MKTECGASAPRPDPAPPAATLPPPVASSREIRHPLGAVSDEARSPPPRRDAHLFGPGGEERWRLEAEARVRARGGAPPPPATFAKVYSDAPPRPGQLIDWREPLPPGFAPGPPPRVLLRALAAPSIREVRAKFEAHTLDAIDDRIAGHSHRARSTGRKTALARAPPRTNAAAGSATRALPALPPPPSTPTPKP